MAVKKITLETKSGKNYFEVQENNSRYTLWKLTPTLSFFGSTKRERLGETKSFGDALTLAKTTVAGSIIDTIID